MAIELAWAWLRFQPESALAKWYEARFAGGGPRRRKIGIVALARKLLVALWRYLETGVVPEVAQLTDRVLIADRGGTRSAEAAASDSTMPPGPTTAS